MDDWYNSRVCPVLVNPIANLNGRAAWPKALIEIALAAGLLGRSWN